MPLSLIIATQAGRRLPGLAVVVPLTLMTALALAQQPAARTPAAAPVARAAADVRVELAKKVPGSRVEDFRPSPVAGMYEMTRGAEVLYVSADGKFAITGDLYELASETNLSERRRRDSRAQLLGAVTEDQMLVFSPKDPKYTVTVFTDIDCGYCRKLHSEMAKYNELGIRVRYLFYPRSGPNSESWDKAVSVWCSPNRNNALTHAKLGEAVKTAKCGANPVARDYELGRDLGLSGTPAIFLANGEMLPGYLPPALLVKRLQAAR